MNTTQLYLQLQKAIEEAPSIPPCQISDPEAWYPDYHHAGDSSSSNIAKRMCAACPVINECLSYALKADERYGVWGGLSPKERSQMQAASGRLKRNLGRPRKETTSW